MEKITVNLTIYPLTIERRPEWEIKEERTMTVEVRYEKGAHGLEAKLKAALRSEAKKHQYGISVSYSRTDMEGGLSFRIINK